MTFITTLEQIALEKGHSLGLSQGIEQGLSRGLSKGVHSGWVQALKSSVTARFPDWNPAWNQHLESVEDASSRQDWLRLAVTLPTARDFQKAIGKDED